MSKSRVKKIIWIYLIWLTAAFTTSCSKQPNSLYESFSNPPTEARPFMRWWWNGDCVEKNEILRELDLMKQAGIGGIEINPIAMPYEVNPKKSGCLEWGSPEWANMVKVATDGCKERNMIADIIIGSGWPLGGEFLKSGETIQAIGLNAIELKGPSSYKANINDVMNPPFTSLRYKGASKLKPMFLTLAPKSVSSFESTSNLLKTIQPDGSFEVVIPAGNYVLLVGSWQEAFRVVMHGAPGSSGQVLDHYNKEAVKRYLDKFANSLNTVLGGKLGNAFRALFIDSIELSGANWTTGFSTIFKERCGYEIEPYLPFIVYKNGYAGFEEAYNLQDDFAETIYRVRYDYYKTIVDVFLENFTQQYHNWCHEQGCLSRYQAYGSPWLVGMAEGYLIPDIPESNGWIFSSSGPYKHGYWVWNKYASSAGHFMNRPIISSETMTNVLGVFAESLNYIKENNDMNFIMGINHDVLHGFNYSPPEAGFPGWVRYGSYFSEQNTWWPYFKYWSDYTSRLSAVFQKAKPRVGIAILHPTADIWGQKGLYRADFQTTPWYSHCLWESLSQNGCTSDYLCEKVIQDASTENGELHIGPMAYKTIFLSDVKTIQPQTAQVLFDFVRKGGKLIFIGKTPSRSPSLKNATESDIQVQEIMSKILQKTTTIPSPEEGTNLMVWMEKIMKQNKIQPTVMVDKPNSHVYQNHFIYESQDLFFFVNNSKTETISFKSTFPTNTKIPWKWDAETGEKMVYPYKENPNSLDITLEPLESLLLVFNTDMDTAKVQPTVIKTDPAINYEINTPWFCEFNPAKETNFTSQLDKLIDLITSTDERIKTFAGNVVYKTTFESNNIAYEILDLGTIHGISEVTLNGKKLGIRWWGRHKYDLKGALNAGENHLEIKVTTVLLNYIKSRKDNPTAQVWTKKQNPVSTGLLGPVQLKTNRLE